MVFNLYGWPVLTTGLIMLGLTLYSWRRGGAVGRAFASMTACLAVWFMGVTRNYFMPGIPGPRWCYFYYFGIALLPAAFFHFTLVFLRLREPVHRRLRAGLLTAGLLFGSLAVFTPWMIHDQRRLFFGLAEQYSALGILFSGYCLLAALVTLALWYRAWRRETDLFHRRRLLILFTGFCFPLLSAADFLPGFGLSWYPSAYLVMLVFVGFEAYAVYVYRVIQLQSALQAFGQRLAAVLLVALPGATVLAGTVAWPEGGNAWKFTAWFLLLAAAGGLFAWFVPEVERWLRRKEAADWRSMTGFLDETVHLKQSAQLVAELRDLLIRTLHPSRLSLVLRADDGTVRYLLHDDQPLREAPPEVAVFLPWLADHPDILVRYDVRNDPACADIRPAAEAALTALGSQVVVPLVQGRDVLGLIGLGEKDDHRLLSWRELEFLTRLKPAATIALNNAFLFDWVEHLTRELMDANATLNARVRSRTRKLSEAFRKLKKLNQEQTDFFTMASHTLRTPLTVIRGIFTMIRQDPNLLTPDKRKWTEIVQAAILRLDALIQDIIDIARMREGRLRLDLGRVVFEPLIHEAIQEVAWLYEEKHIQCRVEADTVTWVEADPRRLKVVLTHLLANAYKFTDPQGQVRVSVRAAEPASLEAFAVVAARGQSFCECRVEDNGEGIPADELTAVFEVFHQVTSSQRRYQGNGLGLYIVKRIIEGHGGRVRVESCPGRGTSVRFVLPCA